MTVFFFLFGLLCFYLCAWNASFHLCLHVWFVYVLSCPPTPPYSLPPETQEVSVDGDSTPGGVAVPEISVTGVSGERMVNGDSLRPRSDGRNHLDDSLGASPEVSTDSRGHDSGSRSQEVRRQKSVRRMVENEGSGSASAGRSQYWDPTFPLPSPTPGVT